MMIARLAALFQSALLLVEPEKAHRLTLEALKRLPVPEARPDDLRLSTSLFGLSFSNPFGVAAGFDKNAEVPDVMLRLGFGHIEVGGVTPRPQPGNPRPRVFRLPRDEALINRLGFNNQGLDAMRERLASRRRARGIIGVNLGSNKDTVDRASDFVALVRGLAEFVDYFTVNVSSPNTPGLRDLQGERALDELLARIVEARDSEAKRRPLLVKIAPDIDEIALDGICAVISRRKIDGLVLTNTLVARPKLRDGTVGRETGGLSGRPVFRRSTQVLAKAHQRLEGRVPLIGCGGIDSGEAAWTKIRAGASLVQLYTGLVYRGLPLLDDMKAAVLAKMAAAGFASLEAAVGGDAADWARERL